MMSVEEFTGKTVWDILVSEFEIDLNKNYSTSKHVKNMIINRFSM